MKKFNCLITIFLLVASLTPPHSILAEPLYKEEKKSERLPFKIFVSAIGGFFVGITATYLFMNSSQANGENIIELKKKINNLENDNGRLVSRLKLQKIRSWPVKDNTLVYGSVNQYNEKGFAACLHIAAHLLEGYLKNPIQDLYKKNILDQICKEGSEYHKGNNADEFLSIFKEHKKKYHFKQIKVDPGVCFDNLVQPKTSNGEDKIKVNITKAIKKKMLCSTSKSWGRSLGLDRSCR